jgi:hypothetical protein
MIVSIAFRGETWIFLIIYNPNEHTFVLCIDDDASIKTDLPLASSTVLYIV